MKKNAVIFLFIVVMLGCGRKYSWGIQAGSDNLSMQDIPEMVGISKSSFKMGTDQPRSVRGMSIFEEDSSPMHEVELSKFYFAKTYVTVKLFKKFLADVEKDTNLAGYINQGNLLKNSEGRKIESVISSELSPVLYINWDEAILFCNWLSLKMGYTPVYLVSGIPNRIVTISKKTMKVEWDRTADGFRLPTEAEFEYILRDGGKSDKELNDQYQWQHFALGESNSVPSVYDGSRNSMGILFLENIQEYQWNVYGLYSDKKTKDPIGPDKQKKLSRRLSRGYQNYDGDSTYLMRRTYSQGSTGDFITLRLARSYKEGN